MVAAIDQDQALPERGRNNKEHLAKVNHLPPSPLSLQNIPTALKQTPHLSKAQPSDNKCENGGQEDPY